MRTRQTGCGGREGRGGPGPGSSRQHRGQWETAAYWLLYVVAFLAALLHWRADNGLLALLCAIAVVVSIGFLTSSDRLARGGSNRT